MVGGGVLMVLMGALAMRGTSVVGTSTDAMIRMTPMHGAVHALGGVLSIGIGLLLKDVVRVNAALVYAALFALGFVLTLVSSDFFGTMEVPVNNAVHFMHATVGSITLATAYLARAEARTAALAEPH